VSSPQILGRLAPQIAQVLLVRLCLAASSETTCSVARVPTARRPGKTCGVRVSSPAAQVRGQVNAAVLLMCEHGGEPREGGRAHSRHLHQLDYQVFLLYCWNHPKAWTCWTYDYLTAELPVSYNLLEDSITERGPSALVVSSAASSCPSPRAGRTVIVAAAAPQTIVSVQLGHVITPAAARPPSQIASALAHPRRGDRVPPRIRRVLA
jgi:hypothetical protein